MFSLFYYFCSMKQVLFLFGLFSLTFLASCVEDSPYIDLEATDLRTYLSATPPPAQHKAVLIEDITGVRCINCPQAAATAASIASARTEDSVVVVALYSKEYNTTLTSPYSGFPGLNSSFSSQIISQMGPPVGLPYGYIDRSNFGGSNRWIQPSLWSAKVNERLKMSSPVNISFTKSVSGNKLTASITMEYTATISGNHKYSLLITESGVVSKRLGTSGEDPNYVHNHVLRYAFGSATGSAFPASLVPGRKFVKDIEYTLPSDIKIDNCSLICIISDVATEEVINVRQIHLK